jgi:hypothetical protein
MEQGDPEVNDVSVSGETIVADVRIANNCADCGTELTAADLNAECDLPLPEGWRSEPCECGKCGGSGSITTTSNPDDPEVPKVTGPCDECDGTGQLAAHDATEFEVEEVSSEATSRALGKGRGTRTFYGFSLVADVTHPAFEDWSAEVTLEADEQASAMEQQY